MKWKILILLSIYFNKFVLSFSIRENETRIEGNTNLKLGCLLDILKIINIHSKPCSDGKGNLFRKDMLNQSRMYIIQEMSTYKETV